MLYMQEGAPAHCGRSVRDVLRNTYPDRWVGRRHTARPPRSTELNPPYSNLQAQQKALEYATPTDNEKALHRGYLSDSPQLARYLCTDTAVHDQTCRSVH
jgi:hypothetical protein